MKLIDRKNKVIFSDTISQDRNGKVQNKTKGHSYLNQTWMLDPKKINR